jgi:hypothetical protein
MDNSFSEQIQLKSEICPEIKDSYAV